MNNIHSTDALLYNTFSSQHCKEDYKSCNSNYSLNIPELNIQNSKMKSDTRDVELFFEKTENRKAEGGLRVAGYFKFNYLRCEGNWWINNFSDKPLSIVPSRLSEEIEDCISQANYPVLSLPLISIITVVYNDSENLRKTIESVINQRYPNIEYIVIDGGSTDGTLDILRRYNDKINYWISEQDTGIYDAMNKGIKVALGQGLLFLNAGDYFVGNVLDLNVSIPSYLTVKTKNRLDRCVNIRIRNYRLGIPYCHQGILFKNVGILYNTQYRVASDYDFYLMHRYKYLNLIRTSGYIYYDNNGFSKKNCKIRDAETAEIIKKRFGYIWFFLFLVKSKLKSIIIILITQVTEPRLTRWN